MDRYWRAILVALVTSFVLDGCTVIHSVWRADATHPVRGQQVLLVDPDVELYVRTIDSVELQSDWTTAARAHIVSALDEELRAKGFRVIRYEPPLDPAERRVHEQLLKLHEVVGRVGFLLSTKKYRLDVSLGEDVQTLRGPQGVEYALFVYIRESYATPGRATAEVTTAVVSSFLSLGMAPTGWPGPDVAYGAWMSLVDLHTGNILWTPLKAPVGWGDMRTAESARQQMRLLLGKFPE